MTENASAGSAEQSQTPSATDEKPSAVRNLADEITSKVNGSKDAVRAQLVARFSDREINSRVDVLEKAFEHHKVLKNALNRVKPDTITYDGDGKVASATFTKTALDAKKKIEEGYKKFDAALTTALESGTAESFTKLKEAHDKTKDLAKAGGKGAATEEAAAE